MSRHSCNAYWSLKTECLARVPSSFFEPGARFLLMRCMSSCIAAVRCLQTALQHTRRWGSGGDESRCQWYDACKGSARQREKCRINMKRAEAVWVTPILLQSSGRGSRWRQSLRLGCREGRRSNSGFDSGFGFGFGHLRKHCIGCKICKMGTFRRA